MPLQPSASDDGGRAASMDSYLGGPEKMPSGGSPATVEELLNGLQGKPLTLDGPTISQLLGPTRGVSDVRVTNKQPPEIKISNVFNISEASSGKGVAAEVMANLGGAVKSAVESSFSD